jgi:hypothetical protein
LNVTNSKKFRLLHQKTETIQKFWLNQKQKTMKAKLIWTTVCILFATSTMVKAVNYRIQNSLPASCHENIVNKLTAPEVSKVNNADLYELNNFNLPWNSTDLVSTDTELNFDDNLIHQETAVSPINDGQSELWKILSACRDRICKIPVGMEGFMSLESWQVDDHVWCNEFSMIVFTGE